jgi:hypothetical protein
MTWPTCRLVFHPRCKSDPGSCREVIAGGGQGGLSVRDDQPPVLLVVHDLLAMGRATIIVPRGAHQIAQRPAESLSPRGICMSSSDLLADAASTSLWRSKGCALIASSGRCGLPGGSWHGRSEMPGCPDGEEGRIQMPVAVSPAPRGAAVSARCPSAPRQRARLPATTGPTLSGERVR